MTKRVSDADKVVGVYHQLVELYTQWQADRSVMNRRWQDFMKTDQAFHKAVENLEAITPGVKKSLSQSLNKLSSTVPEIRESIDDSIARLENLTPNVKQSLKKAVNDAFERAEDRIVKSVHRKLNDELTDGVSRLKREIGWASDAVERVVDQSKRQFRWALWKTGIIAGLCSVLSSFIFCLWLAKLWFPANLVPFSSDDLWALEAGYDWADTYNHLTQKEQEQLLKWKIQGNERRSLLKKKGEVMHVK